MFTLRLSKTLKKAPRLPNLPISLFTSKFPTLPSTSSTPKPPAPQNSSLTPTQTQPQDLSHPETAQKGPNSLLKGSFGPSAVAEIPQSKAEVQAFIKGKKKERIERRKKNFEIEERVRSRRKDGAMMLETAEEVEWFYNSYVQPIMEEQEKNPNHIAMKKYSDMGIVPSNVLERAQFLQGLHNEVYAENPELAITSPEMATPEHKAIVDDLVYKKALTKAGYDPKEFAEKNTSQTSFPNFEQTEDQGINFEELAQLFSKEEIEENDIRRMSNVSSFDKDFEKNKELMKEIQDEEREKEVEKKEEIKQQPPPEMQDDFDILSQIAKSVEENDRQIINPPETAQLIEKEDSSQQLDHAHKHYFSNLPVLKQMNFNDRDHLSKFKIRNARNTTEYLKQTANKLQVMLEQYTPADFNKVKFYKLNSDQILTFMTSPNFTQNASMKKVIESFIHLYKTRELSHYSRSEILDLLKPITTNHTYLEEAPPSYVSSLVYTVMKMGIEDDEIWFSLADYLMKHSEEMTVRDLGQYLLGLHHASKNRPLTVDFSEEFSQLELVIVKKFDESEENDLMSLTQILTAYSKGYLGSVEFFSAMEKFILEYVHENTKDLDTHKKKKKTCMVEVSNILYSYALTDYVSNEILEDLLPVLLKLLPTIKQREVPALIISMKALDKANMFKGEIVTEFEKAFIANYQYMKANDLSDFYYIYTNVLMQPNTDSKVVGSSKFYNYLQKGISKLVKTFTMQDLLKIFYMFETEYNLLYTGRSRTSIREKLKRQARYLFSQDRKYDKLDKEDLKELKRLSQPNKPEDLDIYKEVIEGKRDASDWFKAAKEITRRR